MDESKIFYDRTPALSHNAVITMVTGARGGGKTFGYKEWCVTSDAEFVWVRRYDTEMEKCQKTFLADMVHTGVIKDPDRWMVRGGKLWHTVSEKEDPVPGAVYLNHDKKRWRAKGHFIALSKQAIEKSGSFPNVDKMIFDECFLKPHGSHHYLTDEVECFLELMETVNRLRLDGRKEVRAVLLGNKTSYLNPWYAYYGIKPFTGRFAWAPGKKGLVLVENYTNGEFADLKKETRFGRLIDGTRYGDYAIENEAWYDDGDSFICKKPKNANPVLVMVYHGKRYTLWHNGDEYYIGEYARVDRTCALTTDDMSDGVRYSDRTLKALRTIYEGGRLWFRDANVKFEILDALQHYASLKR